MSGTDITHIIHTAWKWKEEECENIEGECRKIESKHGTEIVYIEENQSFEIKGTEHKQLEETVDDLLKFLRYKASASEKRFVVPRRLKKNVRQPENAISGRTGKPLPLKEKIQPMIIEDTENFKDTFKFNTRIGGVLGRDYKGFYLPCDYWKDICYDCGVKGDIIYNTCNNCEDNGDFNNEACDKCGVKSMIKITSGKEKNITKAIERLERLQMNYNRGPFRQKRIHLVHYPNQHTIFKLYFCKLCEHPYFNNTVRTELEDVYILVAATYNPHTQEYVLPQSIPGPSSQSSYYYNRDRGNATARSETGDRRFSRSPPPNPPSISEDPRIHKIPFGIILKNYNFPEMKNALEEGLEYARAHKGEIRFYGSLGKELFTKVNREVGERLWDFKDLKDVVSQYGVKPGFDGIATYHSIYMGDASFAHYEITADVSYSGNVDRDIEEGRCSEICMYISTAVSLKKVTSKWNPLVNIDCTVLDRKSDFSMNLVTRHNIRCDIKPFITFVNKTSVDPTEDPEITYENIDKFLKVKSIKFRRVKKVKLQKSFVAEMTRVDELAILDRSNSNKKTGKFGYIEPYYTIEIYNDLHKEIFKQNFSIKTGELAEWTVDDILGPDSENLTAFVIRMLTLIESYHKSTGEAESKIRRINGQQIIDLMDKKSSN